MKFINLTLHNVNVFDKETNSFLVFYPQNPPARCIEIFTNQEIEQINGYNIDIYNNLSYSEVIDLPDPQNDVGYIVSVLVGLAAKNRTDLYMPYKIMRNDKKQIIGCEGLARLNNNG